MVTVTTITMTTMTMTKAAATTTATTADDINNDGYSGRDGHHRMRKGRRHDNGTTPLVRVGGRGGFEEEVGRLWEVDGQGGGGSVEEEEESK